MFCERLNGKCELILNPSVLLCAVIMIAPALTITSVHAKDLHISNNHLRVIYSDENDTLAVTSTETGQSFINGKWC